MLNCRCTKPADGKTQLGYLLGLLLAGLLAISCGRGSGSPSLPPTDGTAAQLTGAEIQKLNALRIKILVPTYIPQGFRLKGVIGEVSRPLFEGGIGYVLGYGTEESDPASLFIESLAWKARGWLGATCVTPIASPLFGESLLAVLPEQDAVKNRNPFEKPFEYCDEATLQKKAWALVVKELSENGETGPFYRVGGTWMIPKEAVKVVESLRWLKP